MDLKAGMSWQKDEWSKVKKSSGRKADISRSLPSNWTVTINIRLFSKTMRVNAGISEPFGHFYSLVYTTPF